MHDLPVKQDFRLTILTVLSILLLSLHLTDDIVRGFAPAQMSTLYGVLILAVWLLGVLLFAGTRLGYVIVLLGSLLGAGIPIVHLRGAGVGGLIAASSGGFFFIWTLIVLGASAGVSFVLAACGLWRVRNAKPNTRA